MYKRKERYLQKRSFRNYSVKHTTHYCKSYNDEKKAKTCVPGEKAIIQQISIVHFLASVFFVLYHVNFSLFFPSLNVAVCVQLEVSAGGAKARDVEEVLGAAGAGDVDDGAQAAVAAVVGPVQALEVAVAVRVLEHGQDGVEVPVDAGLEADVEDRGVGELEEEPRGGVDGEAARGQVRVLLSQPRNHVSQNYT